MNIRWAASLWRWYLSWILNLGNSKKKKREKGKAKRKCWERPSDVSGLMYSKNFKLLTFEEWRTTVQTDLWKKLSLFLAPKAKSGTKRQQPTGEAPKGNSQLLKMWRCQETVFFFSLLEVGMALWNREDTDVFESHTGRTLTWKSQI